MAEQVLSRYNARGLGPLIPMCESVGGGMGNSSKRKSIIILNSVSRVIFVAALFSLGVALSLANARAQVRVPVRRASNIDVRVNGRNSTAKLVRCGSFAIAQRVQAQSAMIKNALTRLQTTVPDAEVKLSPITAAVEVVRCSNALTGPAEGRSGMDIVRAFIRENRELYGLSENDLASLRFIGESVNRFSGLRMVRVEQVINGLPVFQSETRFILDREGRLIRSTGLLIPDATRLAPAVTKVITPQEALRSAMSSLGIPLDASRMKLTKAGIVVSDAKVSSNVPGSLVYFLLAPGKLIPAWAQVTFLDGDDGDWYTLVDATTGELLWRKNIRDNASTQDAHFSVYVQSDGKTPADNPAPQSPNTLDPGSGMQFPEIPRTTVSMLAVEDIAASPNGWIDDCAAVCTANETQTIGNNVHAYLDRIGGDDNNIPDTDATSVLDGDGKPTGNPDVDERNRDFLGTTPRDYTFLPPPQEGDPETGQTATGDGANGTLRIDAFRRAVIAQMFYVANWYHDRLYELGFDEAAGNFQQTNFTGVGAGGDRVLAEAEDSSGTNDATFSTPPDGMPGRAQMYRFVSPTIDRDSGIDNELYLHELTHGVSNRLIGNAAGLQWDIGRGLGEGWSDFYALSLLHNTDGDDPNSNYPLGAYVAYKLGGLVDNYVYGLRRFPYSTNNNVNPLTWADVDETTADMGGGIMPSLLGLEFNGAAEVRNLGELWALSLWEVRSRIIAANGNDVASGNNITLSLVTDGMKMTPINPSFPDARDALIEADCAANACANEDAIWGGFADRGLGYAAYSPIKYTSGYVSSHFGLVESFALPYLDIHLITIDDSAGNNNGAIDPGESVKLAVKLKNPWRNFSKHASQINARLTTASGEVIIIDGHSEYPGIPAQGSSDGDILAFNVASTAICGQSLKFTLTTNSSLGTHAIDFVLRVGIRTGTLSPVNYTRDPNPDLAISQLDRRGVTDTLNITDDYEIADLDFRIDSVTHTFTGDLSFEVRSPGGYGNDFVSLIGELVDFGSGDNIQGMVIDDAANDEMLVASPGEAPYTGSWLPVFNESSCVAAGLGPPDPVGQLSGFNGMSTQGVWKLQVSDQFAPDGGTLNSWSLVITPKAFSCSALLMPTSAFSRKAHGSAGVFDIPLAISGRPGVECRPGGGTGDYTVLMIFSNPVSVTGIPKARITVGKGDVGSGGIIDPNGAVAIFGRVVTVPLTNVTNAQTILITLNGVNDGVHPVSNVSVPMSILLGDTTGNGSVNASDTSQIKSATGTAGASRMDITLNGFVNASDVSLVKSKSGTALP